MHPRLAAAAILAVASAVLAFLFVVDPEQTRLIPPCPFHHLTGLECPGCGTTRALHDLVHGRLLAALGHNPLLLVYLPILIYGAIAQMVLLVRGRALPRLLFRPVWIWSLLGVIVSFWIGRNL